METEAQKIGFIAKLIGGGIVGLILLVAGCQSVNVVDTGYVGIKRTFQQVVGEPLSPGLHMTIPFTQDIVQLDTRTLKWPSETVAYTKDIQQATVRFVLNYSLDPAAAGEVFQTVGPAWSEKLVAQVVHKAIKDVFGHYNAVDLISQRDAASQQIAEVVRVGLNERNILVPANGFQLTNIDFSKVFEHAVEEKVVAQQEAIREQNNTVKIEELAKQAIATARGEADSTLLKAKAEAESIRIRAQALEANPRLVEFEAVKRWNGELPTNMYGSAPVPFINVPAGK